MNCKLSEDQQMIINMVRDFCVAEIDPIAKKTDLDTRYLLENYRKMNALGLMGMLIPEELGGSNSGPVTFILALEEVASHCASTAITMSVTNMVCDMIYQFGSDAQKKKIIPLIIGSNAHPASFCLTESHAGSDATHIETKGTLQENHYILNGSKIFVTNGGYSNVFIVFAKTSSADKKNITAFIIERNTPGFSVGKEEDKMGLKGSSTVVINLDNVRVPADQILGTVGEGFKIAMTALNGGRIGVSAQANGIAAAALSESIHYAKERQQFNKPIGSFQAIRFMLAEMSTRLNASRLLMLKAATLKQEKKPFQYESAIAKLFASETANMITDNAVQIHGGYGYMKEYNVERYFRDARVTTIYEGTSEIQRMVIGKKLIQEGIIE